MSPHDLWKRRVNGFWGEVVPYFRYVAQGGFTSFLALGFITSVIYYARWIKQLPEGYPVHWFAALVLAPMLYFGTVRSFIKAADLVYLLPMERTLAVTFFRYAFRYSFVIQIIVVFAGLAVVWPLYEHSKGSQAEPFLGLFAQLVLMKFVSLYGAWRENRFCDSIMRYIFKTFRAVIVVLLVIVTFYKPLSVSLPFAALLLLTYSVSLRIPDSYLLNWELLMRLERLHRSRYFSFISWFIDVPEEAPAKIKKRWLLARVTHLLPFTKSYTYTYLGIKTFVRTDLIGITFRLAALAAFILCIFPQSYVKAAVYIFFLYSIVLQASTLEQYHRYISWVHIYPIRSSDRFQSLAKVVFVVHLIYIILLFVPIIFTAAWSWEWFVLPVFVSGLSMVYCRKILPRKWSKAE